MRQARLEEEEEQEVVQMLAVPLAAMKTRKVSMLVLVLLLTMSWDSA